MMQRGDSADHEDPSAEREEGQRWGFRFTLAGFENATIVATSGEIAQVGVGINAGGRINEHVGFVVTGSKLQLSLIEPATDDVGFGRHIDASRGLDRMSARRLCRNAKGFRDEWGIRGQRLNDRRGLEAGAVRQQDHRCCGGRNRDDNEAQPFLPRVR